MNSITKNPAVVATTAMGLLLACAALPASAATIVNVTETGGDNEAADTITAKWTGQTWNVSVDNEPVNGLFIGTEFTLGTFAHTAPAFVDRNHRYHDDITSGQTIPDYLIDQEYIMSGNDNRDNANYRLDVAVAVPVTVYLLIDNRLQDNVNGDPPTFGPVNMQWVIDEGWLPTDNGFNRALNPLVPDEVAFDEGADSDIDQWFSVYKKDFPAGTFTLKQPENATRNMYGAVVVPKPVGNDPISSFISAPSSIPPGNQSTLSWNIHTGATSASIDQGIGNVLPLTTGGIGNTVVTPSVDTTYTLSVSSPAGDAVRPAVVQVRPLAFFQASSTFVNPGTPVTLSWRIRQDAVASISGIGSVAPFTAADGTGSVVVNPIANTTYTLTSTASGRMEEASVLIVMRPSGTVFAIIDIGALNARPEPGAVSDMEIGAGVHNTNATDLFPTPLVSDTGVDFSIAIDNLDPTGVPFGGLDWRDRGDGPAQALVRLAEDHVKNNAGMVHVTLTDLPAGTYNVTSYHVDADNSQCEAIRILVTDAARAAEDAGVLGNAAFPGAIPTAGGLTTALVDEHSARFTITSDGANPVSIWFDGTLAADIEVPLSGLWLTLAAPPAMLNIVSITRTESVGSTTMAIEFFSTPGRTYRVRASSDATTWADLVTNLPAAAGATTTFTEAGIPLATRRRYYQIFGN